MRSPRIAVIIGAYLFECLAGGLAFALIGAIAHVSTGGTFGPIAGQMMLAALLGGAALAGYFALPASFVISYAEGEAVRSPFYYVGWGSLGGATLAVFVLLAMLFYRNSFGPYLAAMMIAAGATVGLAYWIFAGRNAGASHTPPELPAISKTGQGPIV
jgi:hypothetical protein